MTAPRRVPRHGSASAAHADAADDAGRDDIHLTALLHIRLCRCVYRNLQCAGKACQEAHDRMNQHFDLPDIDTGNLSSFRIGTYRIDLAAHGRVHFIKMKKIT